MYIISLMHLAGAEKNAEEACPSLMFIFTPSLRNFKMAAVMDLPEGGVVC